MDYLGKVKPDKNIVFVFVFSSSHRRDSVLLSAFHAFLVRQETWFDLDFNGNHSTSIRLQPPTPSLKSVVDPYRKAVTSHPKCICELELKAL